MKTLDKIIDWNNLSFGEIEKIKGETVIWENIPYLITASLYKYDNGRTILGIMSERKNWLTFYIEDKDLRKTFQKFELINCNCNEI